MMKIMRVGDGTIIKILNQFNKKGNLRKKNIFQISRKSFTKELPSIDHRAGMSLAQKPGPGKRTPGPSCSWVLSLDFCQRRAALNCDDDIR